MKKKTIVAWLTRVQELIEDASGPVLKKGPFKGHSRTKPVKWLTNLVKQMDSVRPKDDKFDENIWMAYQLGWVLFLWAHYCRYAKSQDPNRPLEIRRKSQNAWAKDMQTFEEIINDMPGIEKVFKQKWDDPFGPNAKDGTFV